MIYKTSTVPLEPIKTLQKLRPDTHTNRFVLFKKLRELCHIVTTTDLKYTSEGVGPPLHPASSRGLAASSNRVGSATTTPPRARTPPTIHPFILPPPTTPPGMDL